MCDNFQEIEELLKQLIKSVIGSFQDVEITEVQEFVDVGEYGVALETFVSIVEEESRLISIDSVALVKKSAHLMGMDESSIELKLRNQILES